MSSPSPNGSNGRSSRGRFAKGNPGGPGNPYAKRIATLRACFLAAVNEADMIAIATMALNMAKGGDLQAMKLVLSYVVGQPESLLQSKLDSDGSLILTAVEP